MAFPEPVSARPGNDVHQVPEHSCRMVAAVPERTQESGELYCHLNDAGELWDTTELEQQQHAARPPDLSRECSLRTKRAAETEPLKMQLQDELSLHSIIAKQLHTLNAHFESVAATQMELQLALTLLAPSMSPSDLKEGGSPAGLLDVPVSSIGAPQEDAARLASKPSEATLFGNHMACAAPARVSGTDPGPMASKERRTTIFRGLRRRKNRNNFSGLRTRSEDLAELNTIFSRGDVVERDNITKRTLVQKEVAVDSFIGVIILVNAVFIGYCIDASESEAGSIFAIDCVFSLLFLLELLFKIALNGLRSHFCGDARKLNAFDFSLIVVDTTQLVMTTARSGEENAEVDVSHASLFRILRLVRLARLLRFLRYSMFDDFMAMIGGMIGGVCTLFWAAVLYSFAIYCMSLVFREAFGNGRVQDVHEYFKSVPRSMFTMFRCSFGDCSSERGTPIFEHVQNHYGLSYSFLYFIFVFSVTIGLFNVISAIFVEATLAAATSMRHKAKKARLQNEDLWCTRITTLLKLLAERQGVYIEPRERLVDIVEKLYDIDFTAEQMKNLSAEPQIRQVLEDLDIEPEDHDHLGAILDPDQNGKITTIELMDGIRSLRGEPKRSDIVQLDLMLRSMMGVVQEIHALLERVATGSHKADMKRH
eukprot:TRINITY_DN14001_c0_g2_i2.p1 TRINITY_DN14001_c0_g2~~TRINITY_DN14001_c0_g2_i2.p1  ORF type:complete len:673 (+),score=81.20 TRINITY_DN14001_c0_g2_i2:67-2019(+)